MTGRLVLSPLTRRQQSGCGEVGYSLRRMRLVTGLVLAAVVAAGSLGCGSDDPSPVRTRPLSGEEIARYESGSPERAFIEWWRDVQFNNDRGIAERYADSAHVGKKEIATQVPQIQDFFSGIPSIDEVERSGDMATVYALVIGGTGTANKPEPVAVRLQLAGATWQLADNDLIEGIITTSARAQARARAEGNAAPTGTTESGQGQGPANNKPENGGKTNPEPPASGGSPAPAGAP